MRRRRKRSPQTSCSDSDSDFNDEDFSCSKMAPRKKTQPKNANSNQQRKKLALPKAQRSNDTHNNDAEEKQVNKTEIDVFDSEDDVVANDKGRRLQTLLDVVFDKDGGQLTPVASHLTGGFSSEVKKEQSESVHVERSVSESPAIHNVEKKQASNLSSECICLNKEGLDVSYCEGALSTRDKSQDFHTLLDVVLEKDETEIPMPVLSYLTAGVCKVDSHKEIKEGTKKEECMSETDKEDYLCSEEEQDDDEDEDYCGDDSDDIEKPKLKQKNKRNGALVALEQSKTDFMVSHVKKSRSRLMHQRMSSVSEDTKKQMTSPTMATNNGKNSPEPSTAEPILREQVDLVGEPDKEPVKSLAKKSKAICKTGSEKTSKSSNITDKFRTVPIGGVKHIPYSLPGARGSLKLNKEPTVEKIGSDCPNSNIMQFQSSFVPHQRVIGLSRRVRPTPLHPYLLKTDK